MVARIVVNNNAKQTDRLFDYEIPEAIDVRVGHHVRVPFGAGNKLLDGYVMYITEESRYKNLKKIEKVTDAVPSFDEKAVQLAEYMRDNYFCTYNDAIRVMIPSGAAVKPCEWVILLPHEAELTPKEKKIAAILEEHGGAIEVNSLMSYFETSVSQQLARMREKKSNYERIPRQRACIG